jgi:hypothetical protein
MRRLTAARAHGSAVSQPRPRLVLSWPMVSNLLPVFETSTLARPSGNAPFNPGQVSEPDEGGHGGRWKAVPTFSFMRYRVSFFTTDRRRHLLVTLNFWERAVLKNRATILETCPKNGTPGHSISPLVLLTAWKPTRRHRSRQQATWATERASRRLHTLC